MSNPSARLHLMRHVRLLLIGSAALAATAAYARDQRTFKTPDEAAAALVQAVRISDDRGIRSVLGPEGSQIASSGDPVEDKAKREEFVSAYDAKHQLTMEGNDKAVLVIGS